MIKKSTNEYLRSLDPDFNSDFANNMDSYEPYSLMAIPLDKDIIHSGNESFENLTIEEDDDFYIEDENLKHSFAINNYKNIIINCDKCQNANTLSLLSNIVENKYSDTFITLRADSKNISSVIKNAKFIGLDFNSRMGAYRCAFKPSSKKLTKISSLSGSFYFKTNVADSYTKKVAGLQVINKLAKDECMLFEYNRPQNLSFHMASVKYPIDILFLDKNNIVKKIAKNVPPGDCGVYACSDSKSVIELNGGTCKSLDIKEGSKVSFFNSPSEKLGSSYIFKLSDFLDIKESKISFFKNANHYRYNLENILTSSSPVNFKQSNLSVKIDKGFIEELKWGFCKSANIVVENSNYSLEHIDGLLKEVFSKYELDNLNFKLVIDNNNIHKISQYIYGDVYYLDNKLYKHSSFQIPSDVKLVGNNINEELKRCKKTFNKVIKDLKKNLKAYNRIADNKEVIKGSKGQLSMSFDRISEKYKAGLLKVKEIVEMLDKIKDASRTIELMSGLVNSAKQCTISIKEYFDIIDDLDSDQFMTLIEEKTSNSEKIFEDLYNSISSLQEFIYKHILGLTILS
jgi:uncharacterized membrane protein (UPF0127 family)